MAKIIHKTTERMTRLGRKIVPVDVRWSILEKVSFIGRFFHFIWDRILACSVCKPARYRRLALQDSPLMPATATIELDGVVRDLSTVTDSDLVSLKISLLGDCDIGKTSFVIKYVGDEQEKRSLQMKGLNLMDKTFFVEGARISFSIWDVAGDKGSSDQIPMACKDAVAILFMFDLTSRSTLNKKSLGRFKQSIRSVFGQNFENVFQSVVGWFSEARKWNQTALPILIGTKFDDFVRLPPDVQWTIVTQARAYARAMKATLFFSSARHNINVNKIFKFIMAKLFNLPWKLERNLTLGEPIIDFSS